MIARIYKPSRSVSQSGFANSKSWVLEIEPTASRDVEPLMGWTSSMDTRSQVVLRFSSRAEAEAYARKNGFSYLVDSEQKIVVTPKSYSDNFRYIPPKDRVSS